MEELIKELIEVIEAMSKPNAFDYLITIVPILLSLIAIIISIRIAHKQNNISLFEKRYKAMETMGLILQLAKQMIKSERDDLDVLISGYMCKNNNSPNGDDVLNFYLDLQLEVGPILLLFPKKTVNDIEKFLDIFLCYTEKVFKDTVTQRDKIILTQAVNLIEEKKSYSNLEKHIKL